MKNKMRKFICATMSCMLIFGGSTGVMAEENSAASESDHVLVQGMDAIKEKGKITVGMMAAIPPYEFHSVNGSEDEIIGSDVELIKEVAKDLGVDYEIKDMEFDGLLMALQTGKIDMVVSSMAPTLERQENADFSDVYYECDYYIVINKDDAEEIVKPEDLEGKTIAVQKTSTMEIIVDEQIPEAKKKGLSKANELSIDVANKKVDATLVDIDTAKLMCKANDKLLMTDISYSAHGDALGAAIAMPKGTDQEVKDTINATIARLSDQIPEWVDEYIELVDVTE